MFISDTDSITNSCKGLRMFARMFKQRRLDAGALLLSSNEVKFVIDRENGSKPMDVEMYQLKEANSVVEEFMLLANISVGKRILEAYPTFALLRRHPVPSADMFEPLIRAGKAAGFNIKVDTSKHLAESLDKCVVPGFPFFNKLIRMMATRWSDKRRGEERRAHEGKERIAHFTSNMIRSLLALHVIQHDPSNLFRQWRSRTEGVLPLWSRLPSIHAFHIADSVS